MTTRAQILLMPGSPALVDALAPAHAPSRGVLECLRAAARNALADTEARAVDIVCPLEQRDYTAHTGSFAAWGAQQVQLGAGNYLPELVARYALAPLEVQVREVREHIGSPDPTVLTVVVVDGSAGLTARAPLALVPGAPELHEQLQDFVGGKAELPDALESLGVFEPRLWEELAELETQQCELCCVDDSLGVGRYVGLWEVCS
ncbi:hypothetical protein [uncultured Corynebacterium sp.]|uniref:hypothetical protein n=1 Tax=uncultured Corynebacterium sp. TaxID=159447 RepID=UPI00261B63EC|nr:hypothetical protein [uncultured Corynebacterium sp.]